MTVLEFLSQFRELTIERERLEERYQEIYQRALNTVCPTDRVVVSPSGYVRNDLLDCCIVDRESVMQKISLVNQKKTEIEDFVDTLPTPLHRLILRLRYLDGLTWPEIHGKLQKVGYSVSLNYLQTRINQAAQTEAEEKWRTYAQRK